MVKAAGMKITLKQNHFSICPRLNFWTSDENTIFEVFDNDNQKTLVSFPILSNPSKSSLINSLQTITQSSNATIVNEETQSYSQEWQYSYVYPQRLSCLIYEFRITWSEKQPSSTKVQLIG